MEVDMGGSLLFVHGTGQRDISGSLQRIRDGLARVAKLRDVAVHGAEWGIAVGPKDLDVTPTLPPEVATRGIGEAPSEAEAATQEWDLRMADPLLELRLLAVLSVTPDTRPIRVAADPPDVVLQQRLSSLSIPSNVLEAAGIDAQTLTAAADEVAAAPETAEAAGAVGDPDDVELVTATARAVVAMVLQVCLGPTATSPAVCRDSVARDDLVAAVLAGLTPVGTKGLPGRVVAKVIGPLAGRLATRLAVRRRGQLMDPTTDFTRDIAFYIRRGDKVRDYIAAEVARLEPPLVILGHSLGGIAAVDLMAGSQRPQAVRLLVTVGSQAPYLFLMDALDTLRPDGQAAPYTPWLNVYNRSDLLSFCAARVFPNTRSIIDAEIDAGVPFPAAHSAYWEQAKLYELLQQHWPV